MRSGSCVSCISWFRFWKTNHESHEKEHETRKVSEPEVTLSLPGFSLLTELEPPNHTKLHEQGRTRTGTAAKSPPGRLGCQDEPMPALKTGHAVGLVLHSSNVSGLKIKHLVGGPIQPDYRVVGHERFFIRQSRRGLRI